MDKKYFEFNAETVAKILLKDKQLKLIMIDYGFFYFKNDFEENTQRDYFFINMSNILLSHKDLIYDNSIESIIKSLNTDLYKQLNELFFDTFKRENEGDEIVKIIKRDLLHQIIYSFKYSGTKSFFQDNLKHFLPPLDFDEIEKEDKKRIYFNSLMKEIDKFTNIIERMSEISDIDNIDTKYLNYIGQLIGYENQDSSLIDNATFRQLLKNILEIYQIKGTAYSLELFLNFLGFDVLVTEYWFDKRYNDSNIITNPYSFVSNTQLDNFSRYLTPIKPTETIPNETSNPYQISDNQLSPILSDIWWDILINQGYEPEQLIGEPIDGFTYSKTFEGQTFDFFKTNVVSFDVIKLDGETLSSEEINKILSYTSFLTPVFLKTLLQYRVPVLLDRYDFILRDYNLYRNVETERWFKDEYRFELEDYNFYRNIENKRLFKDEYNDTYEGFNNLTPLDFTYNEENDKITIYNNFDQQVYKNYLFEGIQIKTEES